MCGGGMLVALLSCIRSSFYWKQICHIYVINFFFNYLHKIFMINCFLMKELPYVFSLTVMVLNDYLVTGEWSSQQRYLTQILANLNYFVFCFFFFGIQKEKLEKRRNAEDCAGHFFHAITMKVDFLSFQAQYLCVRIILKFK